MSADHGDLLVESNGAYCPGGVASNAWNQGFHIFCIIRKATTQLFYDFLCPSQKAGSSRIISEALPKPIHSIYIRRGLEHNVNDGDPEFASPMRIHTKSLIVGKLLGHHGVIQAKISGARTCSSICCNRELQWRLVSAEA